MYCRLFVNSQLLRGIRESSDIVNMPDEKRALAIRAMRNAQRCIEICLRGENVRYQIDHNFDAKYSLVSQWATICGTLHSYDLGPSHILANLSQMFAPLLQGPSSSA